MFVERKDISTAIYDMQYMAICSIIKVIDFQITGVVVLI